MAFANEFISLKDREVYHLEDFEKRLISPNPQRTWAIDRSCGDYLRTVKPEARKLEPGDPDARFEEDFHFHWKGYDFLVAIRIIGEQELQDWPGSVFEEPLNTPGTRRDLYYVRHIGELGKPAHGSPSALKTMRTELLRDLQEALRVGSGGAFAFQTPEEEAIPRHAVLKIAPHAEVSE